MLPRIRLLTMRLHCCHKRYVHQLTGIHPPLSPCHTRDDHILGENSFLRMQCYRHH